jgi:hypothetical protein
MSKATVINACQWEEITDINRLQKIEVNPLGPRHKPLNHGLALELFKDKLLDKGIEYEGEKGLMSPDTLKYAYVVNITHNKEFSFCFGFVNYNNRQKCFTIIAGERVMVCSNEMFTGQIQESKKRHVNSLLGEIDAKMDLGLDYFNKFKDKRVDEIGVMKKREFGEPQLGKVVLNMHRNTTMSNTDIDRVIGEWDNPTYDYGVSKNTAWSFQNACTHVFKKMTSPLAVIDLNVKLKEMIDDCY